MELKRGVFRSCGGPAEIAGHHAVAFKKNMGKRLAVGKSVIQSNFSDRRAGVGKLPIGIFQAQILKICFESGLGIFLEHMRNVGGRVTERSGNTFQSQILSIVFLHIRSNPG